MTQTALDIVALASHLEEVYANQRALDRQVSDQYLQRHVVEQSAGQNQGPDIIRPKPIGSGFAPFLANQDMSFMSGTPFLRVNSPDQKLDRRAQKCELGVNGLWKMSQGYVDVWRRMVKDFVIFGRAWSNVYANPQDWVGLQDIEDDEEYQAFKLDHFPILWRYVEASCTWPTRKPNGDLDQVVEVRSMAARQIEKSWGKEAIIGNKRYGPREEIKVLEYADDEVCQTVVCAESPTVVYEYEHGLGCNPYVIAQPPPPPVNTYGYYWTGATFDLRNSIEELDGRLSDINWNIRQAIRAAKVAKLDPEQRQTIEAGGEPPDITLSPDKVTTMWVGESIENVAPAQTNVDVFQFLSILTGFTREQHIRPVLSGALQAGTSGVLYNTAVQLAEKEFGPQLDSLKAAAEQVGKRLLRAVKVVSTSGGGKPDDIPIIYIGVEGNSYRLSLNAGDVKGMENVLQARLSVAVPLNEQAQIATARLATSPDNPIMAPETAMARYAGIENPMDEAERIHTAQIVRNIMNTVGEAAAERALAILQQPSTPDDALATRIGTLPPQFQEAVRLHAQQLGQQLPSGGASPSGSPNGNLARGAANKVRTGVQQPSQTEATQSQVVGGY